MQATHVGYNNRRYGPPGLLFFGGPFTGAMNVFILCMYSFWGILHDFYGGITILDFQYEGIWEIKKNRSITDYRTITTPDLVTVGLTNNGEKFPQIGKG